eukprot:CAMPEP_0171324158 /NCGR_PEP_ID=MMETSP0816-20121228/116011_1 /TAXON_ID=420281 /ORGANISM="Proboscia inermis, Strain CCAP1064/1" /LENGTH=44 /DNA_ID= /DNA_START= /DNA_END= /DNA_ORIENTATION=
MADSDVGNQVAVPVLFASPQQHRLDQHHLQQNDAEKSVPILLAD